MSETFFGYLMDEQERYTTPFVLEGAEVATQWAYDNKDATFEVRVVDAEDKIAIRIIKGQIRFPPRVSQDEHGTLFFADSLSDEEDFGEICSHCGNEIPEEEVPLIFFTERPPILMARFCGRCIPWVLETYEMVKK
jgi:hypothetical protein